MELNNNTDVHIDSLRQLDNKNSASMSINFDDLEAMAKPTDISLAWQYRNETCIRKSVNNELVPYSIWSTSLEELGQYGSGIELYLKLVKYLCITFFIISCISCYPVYLNSQQSGLDAGNVRQKWDTLAVSNTDKVASKSDQSENESILFKLVVCDALYTSVFLAFIIFFLIQSNRTIKDNFENNVTLADYSIEVDGLPEYDLDETIVQNHFQQFGEVREVYLARRYNGVLKLYKERADLSNELAYLNLLKSYGKKNSHQIKATKEKINKFDQKIKEKEVSSFKTHDELPVIKGFIVFKDFEARKKCFAAYKKDESCCKGLHKQNLNLRLKGKYSLLINRTAAPANIIYENLEVGSCERILRRIISLFIVFIALIASIAMVYGLKLYQDNLPSGDSCSSVDGSKTFLYAKENYKSDTEVYCFCKHQSLSEILNNSEMLNYCGYFFQKISITVTLRVVVSCGVIFVNYIIKIFFRLLGKFERVPNKSTEQLKLMSKVFVATFINTALVILAVNADFSSLKSQTWLPRFIFNSDFNDFNRDWYVQVGSTLVSTMLISTFSPHCMLLLTFYPLGLCKRHCCISRYKTQAEANRKFSGADFDLATRNSQVLTVLFTCFLYSGGMPIMNIICFCTFFLLYWVDKFLLLRHYKKPPILNHYLNIRLIHYLPYAAIIHCGFSLYMYGATDIFPYWLDSNNKSKSNSILDRIQTLSGYTNLVLIVVSISIAIWIFFHTQIFSCIMRKKYVQVDDIKNAQGSVEREILNIRSHGLDSYKIEKNPEYKDLIKSMNSAALIVKGSIFSNSKL